MEKNKGRQSDREECGKKGIVFNNVIGKAFMVNEKKLWLKIQGGNSNTIKHYFNGYNYRMILIEKNISKNVGSVISNDLYI